MRALHDPSGDRRGSTSYGTMGFGCSDTTSRLSRLRSGVFDALQEALAAFDRNAGRQSAGRFSALRHSTQSHRPRQDWLEVVQRPSATACRSAGRFRAGTHPRRRLLDIAHLHLDMTIPLCAAASHALGINHVVIHRRGTTSQEPTTQSGSGFAGSSNPPTPGSRTTDNCAATPTAEAPITTPLYASPPPGSVGKLTLPSREPK